MEENIQAQKVAEDSVLGSSNKENDPLSLVVRKEPQTSGLDETLRIREIAASIVEEVVSTKLEKFKEEMHEMLQSELLNVQKIQALNTLRAQLMIKEESYDDALLRVFSIENEDPVLISMLLKLGANPNIIMQNGETLLTAASIVGHENTVKVLLDAGASPDQKNNKGFTPLFLAAEYGNTGTVKILLDYNANPNLPIKDYKLNFYTPLMVATEHNNLEIVEFLIKNKAIVNKTAYKCIKSEKGQIRLYYTALTIARENKHKSAMKLLLENGANEEYTKPRARYM